MSRLLPFAVVLALTACARDTTGQALEVVVTVDDGALASCVRVEARTGDQALSSAGMLRESRPLDLAVSGGPPLGNPVALVARGFLGRGCEAPQVLNLEGAPLETRFQPGKPRRVTLALHAPGDDVDADHDGYRAAAAFGPDCDDSRADVHPGAVERCDDGVDDDCDGLIDCAQPSCAGLGPPERCDGKDNDCDGVVDEGFSLGYPCTAGYAACARTGQLICAASGAESVCSASPDPTQATPETCNGLDDDCDGVVDNGYPLGTSCTAGAGVCARGGTVVCAGGAAACSASPDLARISREVCNGLDDDCDGQVDQAPQCGGPAGDAAEAVQQTWAPAEALGDLVEPCSDVRRGLVNLTAETGAPWVRAGAEAVRVTYGPDGAAYFQAHYPASRDAGWDLSTRTGLSLAVSAAQPTSYGGWSPAGPTVVLCGRGGGYLRLDPATMQVGVDGGTTVLQVPLDGGAGWTATRAGAFDLRTVDSLEVHLDPLKGLGTGTCTLWLDAVHFD